MKNFLTVLTAVFTLSVSSLALGEDTATPPPAAETGTAVDHLNQNAEKNEGHGKSAEALRRNALRKQEKDEAKMKRKAERAEAKAERKARKAAAKAERRKGKTE
jgi:hypothetical protein